MTRRQRSQFYISENMSRRKLSKIIEEIISRDDEILVPARKIYLLIKYNRPEINLPTFSEFVNFLKRSRKFEVIETGESTPYDLPESVEKLLMQVEIYGTGPRVKLRSVKLTPKLMRDAFLKSYQKMKMGLENLLAQIYAEKDLPSEDLNKVISSFMELREQIDKTIQLLEKLEIYESSVKQRRRKR